MSDIPSNGYPENGNAEETFVPRIAPPEGQRAARGQLFSESENESQEEPQGESESQTSESENEVVHDFGSDAALTVAEVPAVEDSYTPPLDIDLDLEPEPSVNPVRAHDPELGLLEHLGELRNRLLYCFGILFIGVLLTWQFSESLQSWFVAPVREILKTSPGAKIVSTDPLEFFSLTVQFSLASAAILTAPLLLWQIWMFIEPALTHTERRYSLIVVPFSTVLFFMGAALGYAISPLFFKFFLSFQPPGVLAYWKYADTLAIMAKMLLAFGVMFQVPVIIIFLNKIGILSRNLLIEYWRHAVVLIFVVAAVLTPTWDPMTLFFCAGPPCVLYALSIWLVKWL